MFLLYPILVALAAGLLLGGRLANLEAARFRWAGLALLGLVVQVALFSPFVAPWIGVAGAPLYVGSTALVLAAAVRNAGQPGLALAAAGGFLNLAAIVANGGWMPADPGALAALGRSGVATGYSNSVVGGAAVALWPLTDIFAMPRAIPGANVFSVGDALIGLGAFVWLFVTLRRDPAR